MHKQEGPFRIGHNGKNDNFVPPSVILDLLFEASRCPSLKTSYYLEVHIIFGN